MSAARPPAVMILAAGKGTRMRSDRAKVLHPLLDRPMILYVTETACAVASRTVLVVGHQAEAVEAVVADQFDVRFALQREQLGTGHAVGCGLTALEDTDGDVIILCGDVPLVSVGLLESLRAAHRQADNDLTLVAVEFKNPRGYGRIIRDRQGRVSGIVEEADATEAQRAITLVNAGIYCARRPFLDRALSELRSDNAQGEYYLTDIIEIAYRDGRRLDAIVCPDPDEIMGVNSREDLTRVEQVLARNQLKIT